MVRHVPPCDPTPSRASELADRKEAATTEQWLSDFQRTTGKGTVFVSGHVGTWGSTQVRPHVDTLAVTAPERLAAGSSTTVKADLTQHGMSMPVAYPMTHYHPVSSGPPVSRVLSDLGRTVLNLHRDTVRTAREARSGLADLAEAYDRH